MENEKSIKLKGGIYLSIKELMVITGKTSYKSAQREHQSIRDSIAKGKKKLTIREYCEYELISESEIIKILLNYRY